MLVFNTFQGRELLYIWIIILEQEKLVTVELRGSEGIYPRKIRLIALSGPTAAKIFLLTLIKLLPISGFFRELVRSLQGLKVGYLQHDFQFLILQIYQF